MRPPMTRYLPALVTALLVSTVALAAPSLVVNPTTIDRENPSAVAIDVTGVVGSSIVMRLYTDADGDGAIEARDVVVWTDVVEDDIVEWSPSMVSDSEPTTGWLRFDVRMFGALEFPYTVGSFVWQAEDSFDGSTDTVAFAVTQTPQVQSVSGTVRDNSTFLPIPGALVFLEPFCDGGDEAMRFYSALTDEEGNYTIQVPADVDCHHRLLMAEKPGYLTGFLGQPHLIFGGSDNFIAVDTELTPGTHAVTGRVTYETGPRVGEGIPGMAMFVELEGGPPLFSRTFTDENGDYAFVLVDGAWRLESPEEGLDARGAVGLDSEEIMFSVTGGPLALADLQLPAANAFFQGTLRDDAGAALPGHWVSAYQSWPCDPDCYRNEVLTGADGSYTVGVVAPPSPATIEYSLNMPDPLDGLVVQNRGCETISEGETLSGRDLQHLVPTGFVTGRMMDKAGVALENICVQAWGHDQTCNGFGAAATTSCDGSYSIPVVDGEWNVRVEVDEVAVVYRNLDETQAERSLTISGQSESNVDFIIGGWQYHPAITDVEPSDGVAGTHVLIEGHGFSFGSTPQVFFDGVPAAVLQFRPDLGSLIAEVPAGLTPGDNELTVYNPDLDKTSDPACFATAAGSYTPVCTISGLVIDSSSAIEDAGVVVFSDDGERFVRADVSDASGGWSVAIDAPGDYVVIFIPPEGQPWAWGQYLVACGLSQNHLFLPGWQVTGRITSEYGDGLANALVEAEEIGGSHRYAFTVTGDDGLFTLNLGTGSYDVMFDPPLGSRYKSPQGVQQLVSSDVDLGQISMSRGYYFCGNVLDVAGDGVRAEIEAYRKVDGMWSGFADSGSCAGRFELALDAGEYRLEIWPNDLDTDGPTEVKYIDVQGDTVAQFGMVVHDRNALQLTGPEPRISFVEDSPRGQSGQLLLVQAENFDGTVVEVLFSNGLGGFVAGTDTAWDAVRGHIITRVPATATSGPMKLWVDGLEGPELHFEVEAGSFPAGVHTVSGTVTGPSGALDGVGVALFWIDPQDPGCDDDPGVLVDYGTTAPTGAYGPLSHPGGDFFVAFLPPPATTLATAGDQRQSVFGPSTVDASLVDGVAVHVRVIDDELPPNPIGNARVEGGGDGVGDFRLTDPNGDATLYLVPGFVEFEVIPPVGSRLIEQEWQDMIAGPTDYGDLAMTRGVMVGAAVSRQDDGTPLVGLLAEGQRDGMTWEFFFESFTRPDGTFHGPVASGATVQLRVEAPDDLEDLQQVGMTVGSNDCILYPRIGLDSAGFVAGIVRDAGTLLPLEEIDMNSQEDDMGAPGQWSGWARTCPDGSYRIKLPVGQHFLQANNSFMGNGYVEKWYPDAYCDASASSFVVTEGGTATADFDLDLTGNISGQATINTEALDGVGVCATSATLGCQWCGFNSDAFGDYQVSLPPASDYQVTGWAPDFALQCYEGEDGCSSFDPVSVTGGSDSIGVDFEFGCSSGTEVFLDRIETGAPGWTTTGLWHVGVDPTCAPSSKSGVSAFHYNSASCNYDTGGQNTGTLTSPVINAAPAGLSLTYWQLRETDGNCFFTDRSRLFLWVNGAGPTEIWEECDDSNQWMLRVFDLSPYYLPGDNLQIEFEFDTVDGSSNQFQGWMIDDVRLFACNPDPPAEPAGSGSPLPLVMTGRASNSLVVEGVPGATAYNVYIDQLGSYYAPSVLDGTTCTVTIWADNGDGTVTLDVAVPNDSWVVVSASNAGGESAVGSDSSGADRRLIGVWESCPLGP